MEYLTKSSKEVKNELIYNLYKKGVKEKGLNVPNHQNIQNPKFAIPCRLLEILHF